MGLIEALIVFEVVILFSNIYFYNKKQNNINLEFLLLILNLFPIYFLKSLFDLEGAGFLIFILDFIYLGFLVLVFFEVIRLWKRT